MKKMYKWIGIAFGWSLFAGVFALGEHPVQILISFVFAVFITYQALKSPRDPTGRRHKNRNEKILERKFGRYTWLVMYGSIGLLGVLGVYARAVQTPGAVRIFLGGFAAFLVLGLYLCYLVAAGKNESTLDNEDDGPSN